MRAVLRTKHLDESRGVVNLARDLVRKVVQQLLEKLSAQVRSPFPGTRLRQRSYLKIAKNFDVTNDVAPQSCVTRDAETKRRSLGVIRPSIHACDDTSTSGISRSWWIKSGESMVGSVIHAAVTAAIFFRHPSVNTRLVLFDINIVDVTDYCTDPVETLMKVQLGGGTDIGQALAYAESKVVNRRRTIIVLITDFFEGAPLANLFATTKRLVESGVVLLDWQRWTATPTLCSTAAPHRAWHHWVRTSAP